MGDVDKMLEETNRQMEQSKKLLQDLANEVVNLGEVIQPALERQIGVLRSARMSTISEISQSLTAFRDLRQFFLADEHEHEMARLKEFVDVCERLLTLKNSGMLDALADTILKLGGL
jgi:hypothetical protein